MSAIDPAGASAHLWTVQGNAFPTAQGVQSRAVEGRLGQGFINLWTRSISPEDVDQLIDANGNLPGAFMGAELALPGGHVGVFVGGRSQQLFAPAVVSFLEQIDKICT